ncbi:hypothetical protein SFRURICE_005972, partial [Spodoptera frugiperda]
FYEAEVLSLRLSRPIRAEACLYHIIWTLLRNFRKTEKSPAILRSTRESNPRPLNGQWYLRPTTRPLRQSVQTIVDVPNILQCYLCAVLCCCGCVWLPPVIFIGTHCLALVEIDSANRFI